jgi:hypothetical protein
MTMLLGMTALAVDSGYLYNVKADLQNAADAAALAAAITMFDLEGEALDYDMAKLTAIRVAARNLDVAPDTAARMMDFSIGRYDDILDHTQKFVAIADNTSNACRVTLHRTEARGQAVQLFFSAIFGRHQSDVSCRAVAGRASVDAVPALPIALRDPTFGTVDPDVAEKNPGKDGPSFPTDGKQFQLGEDVTVFVFGKGPRPMVHLTLDIEPYKGVAETNFIMGVDGEKHLTASDYENFNIEIGDQYYIENLGTGNNNFGQKLLDRIQDDVPGNNTIVMPIISELPDSRDADGKLTGKVEIVDFVGIHLDRVDQVIIPDPDKEGNTIVIETLVGHVVRASAHGSLTSEPPTVGKGVFTTILLR